MQTVIIRTPSGKTYTIEGCDSLSTGSKYEETFLEIKKNGKTVKLPIDSVFDNGNPSFPHGQDTEYSFRITRELTEEEIKDLGAVINNEEDTEGDTGKPFSEDESIDAFYDAVKKFNN